MADKVQKIRSYLVDMADADGAVTSVAKAIKIDILPYIDSLQEEHVSEDLEEAIGEYCSNPDNFATWIGGKETDDIPLIVKAIKFGAKWQKEKDIKFIFNAKDDGYRLGLAAMKQQMITNAFDGAFIRKNRYTKKNVLNGLDITCDAIQGFTDKDKIKVLFVKED